MNKKFSKQSDIYARYRPDYPQQMYEFIFEQLSSYKTAWDCATGSGQVAKVLADYFEKVYATDISNEQLKHAPKKENITYKNAQAEDSGLPSDYFDLITVGQAIHWFDIDQFYQEVQRVANKHALLAVIGYGMVRINDELDPIIDDLYDEAFQTYFTKSRKYLDNHYKNLPFPFEEIPSPSFKKNYRWTLDELEGYFNSWSAIQKIKTEQNYNPADKTIKRLKVQLSVDKKFEVTFPVFLRLGKIKS